MADFVFKRRQRPIRFTWELDRNGCFRSFSKEFAELLGPQDAALIGLPFDVVRKKLRMGRVPAASKAIKKQRALSGVTLLWPACNSNKVVPLDLSAQPVETKSGEYNGLRGFGVIRSVDAKKSEEPVDPLAVLTKLQAALREESEGTEATSAQAPTELSGSAPDIGLTLEHDQPEGFVQEDIAAIDAPIETETHQVPEIPDASLVHAITAPGFLQSEPEIPELIVDFSEDAEEDSQGIVGDAEHPEPETSPGPDPRKEVMAEEAIEPEVETEADLSAPDKQCDENGLHFLHEEGVIAVEENEGFDQVTDADALHDQAAPLEFAAPVEVEAQQEDVSEPELADQARPASDGPEHVKKEAYLQAFEGKFTEKITPETAEQISADPSTPRPTSNDDFERAIANLPDAPQRKVRTGPRSLAELTNSIVRLVDKHPVPRENAGLSKPEQDAFDKIARALSTEKKDEQSAIPAHVETVKIISATPDETAAIAVAQTDVIEAEVHEEPKPATAAKADNIIQLPAEPVVHDKSLEAEPEQDNVTHVVLPRVPPDIEEAAERAREKTGRIPDKPIVAPIDPRLLDRLPIGVAIVRDRDVVYANDTLLELLGYERFEGLNEAGGLEAIFAEPEECPTPSSQTVDRVVHVRLAEGGVLSVDARMHAVPWNGTQALMISVVEKMQGEAVTDETSAASRVHAPTGAETQVKHLHARIEELETVLATATDGVLVMDQHGTIRSANHSAEALFNASKDDLPGAPFTTFLAGESHIAALDYLDGLVANGISSVLNDGREVICQTLDGDIFPTFLSMGRVSHANEQLFCAVLRDITQFKQAEEELVNARYKAEKANTYKSEYLAKISHEIRTPLNAVIGFSEVMQEERFGEMGNMRYKEYARDIHRSCSHMLTLINDLLDLAKIEAGKVDLAFEAVSAADIINECVALLQPQANDQRVIIRASAPLSVPNIVADPKTLRQITLNLLSNAIKFNRSGGQVIISLVLDPNGEVHLRFRDTGHGMSKADLEAALQPFRRLNASASTEGSGLGLPLTKALVEANRASFSINSEEDEGTLAEVTFPPQRVLAE